MEPPVLFIAGLGNPGRTYERTRHNAGRDLVRHLARDWGRFSTARGVEFVRAPDGAFGAGSLRAGCPDSLMNVSGPPLKAFCDREGIPPNKLLVAVDDFMIPLGTIRLRPKGSSGGHNGLKSVFESFGTEEIPRLRIGVGPVPANRDPAEYVLQKFSATHYDALVSKVFPEIEAGLSVLFNEGFDKAMNLLNGVALSPGVVRPE